MTKEETDLIITEQNKSKEEILKAITKVKSDFHELCKLKDMRIAELQKENLYYKDINETNSAEWEEQGQRVVELEKENVELKKELVEKRQHLDLTEREWAKDMNKMIHYKTLYTKLEKENAELKEQQFSLRNERNTFLAQNEQYEKDLIDFNENITKAKEIMQKLITNAPDTYSGTNIELQQKKMFTFQDTVNKAEQFLNSKVENDRNKSK